VQVLPDSDMKRQLLLLALILLVGLPLSAQVRNQAYTDLESPGLKVRIHNSADHFWNINGSPGFEVPRGSGKHVSSAHALWIGGEDASSQLRLAAETYRQGGNDYFSGPILYNQANSVGWGFDIDSLDRARRLTGLQDGSFLLVEEGGFKRYLTPGGQLSSTNFPTTMKLPAVEELADGSVLVVTDDFQQPTRSSYRFFPNQPTSGVQLPGSGNRTAPFTKRLANGLVLVFSQTSWELYNPQNNQFVPFPIAGYQAAGPMYDVHPDTLMALPGGSPSVTNPNPDFGSSRSTFMINPATQTAVPGPDMILSRLRPIMLTTPSGEHYVFGGNRLQDTVERYNPLTRAFEYAGQLGMTGRDCQGVVLPNGTFLLSMQDDLGFHNQLVRYDPATQTATPIRYYKKGHLLALTPQARVAFQSDVARISLLDLDYRTVQNEPYQYVWQLSSTQIAQFRQDFANGQVDFQRYPDIATWPGNGRTQLGEPAQLAPYVDVNLDGAYEPSIDGDYPCIRGDHATWSVYHDYGIHTGTGALRLGAEVESMAYAVDCNLRPCPDPDMEYVLFHHVEIYNPTSIICSDLYIGNYHDADLGNAFDDYVGCDTSLGLAFCYNGDAVDDGPSGYGAAPPATGSLFLPNGESSGMKHFHAFQNDFSLMGNPEVSTHYYGYLRSFWKDGSYAVNDGGDGYSQSGGSRTNYMYAGDPGFCGGASSGWSEVSANNSPFDRRYVQSIGPLDYQPLSTISFDYAVLYGQGTDHLNSVCELKANAAALLTWWPALQQAACSSAPLSARDPQAATLGLTIAPNPASTRADLRLDTPLRARTQLRVSDLAGRVHTQAELPAGTQAHTLDLQDLPAGLYLVQLSSSEGSAVQRIAVQR
jgi:Secretion system C-terminal sorting domain